MDEQPLDLRIAAGLVDTFAGEGPFTIFAPTDDAFAVLPEGTVEALPEDIPALTDILESAVQSVKGNSMWCRYCISSPRIEEWTSLVDATRQRFGSRAVGFRLIRVDRIS